MEKEKLDQLFEPFRQLEDGNPAGGSGLGLAISKSLCKAMGGDIHFQSSVGKGSLFTAEFHLPVAMKKSRATLENEGENLPTLTLTSMDSSNVTDKVLRILVVDDNPNNLLITTKLSEHLGFKADTVNSGVKALQVMENEHFDIVLMDIRMAPIDGIETSRRIRSGAAGDANRGVYIVALTAHALAGDRQKCLNAGLDDYLSKPLSLDQLSRSLNRAKESILGEL